MKRVMNLYCGPVALVWVGVLLFLEANSVGVVAFVLPAFSSSSFSTRLQASSSSSSSSPSPDSSNNKKKTAKVSRRVRFLNRIGFLQTSKDNFELHQTSANVNLRTTISSKDTKKSRPKFHVNTLEELDAYWEDQERRFRITNTMNDNGNGNNNDDEINYDALLKSLHVQGDTQLIGSPERADYTHPVVKILHERKRRREQQHHQGDNDASGENVNDDGCRVALAIEGGGMRGCISAGMVCAVHHLNLTSSLDVVYGSSAGTIVGAYLITGQLPWFGPEVYYDCLTTAGRQFIDTRRLLRALGFGLLDPRLLRDVLTRPHHGKPVLNLPYLLKKTVQETKPIDWNKFVEKQKVLPLKVVASGLKSEKAVVLSMENKAFETLPELANCMHSSCLLPGIAGPLMNLDKRALLGAEEVASSSENGSSSTSSQNRKKMVLGNNLGGDHYEPLADALLYEPLPYRSAVKEGATHVVVLRTRPDGTDVTGKGGIFEHLIFRRFFLRKNQLPNMFQRLKMQLHKKLYAEDIITLNEASRDFRDYRDTYRPHLMPVALAPESQEISRLETDRAAIFDGMRRGFARAYDCLAEDPAERGRGAIVAREFFPDEILDYDPLSISGTAALGESAFAAYLRQQSITPKAWTKKNRDSDHVPEQLTTARQR